MHACACVCSWMCRCICECTCMCVRMLMEASRKPWVLFSSNYSPRCFLTGSLTTGNSPPRLGCLTKKSQESDNFYLTSARITGMCFYAHLCWVSSEGQLQVLMLSRWAPYRWSQLPGLNSSSRYCSLLIGCQLLQELGLWVLSWRIFKKPARQTSQKVHPSALDSGSEEFKVPTGNPRGETLGQVIYLVQGFRNWIHFLTCYQEGGRKEKANFSFPFPSQISKYHRKTRQDRVDTATDSIRCQPGLHFHPQALGSSLWTDCSCQSISLF